jgi:hypothetical protein
MRQTFSALRLKLPGRKIAKPISCSLMLEVYTKISQTSNFDRESAGLSLLSRQLKCSCSLSQKNSSYIFVSVLTSPRQVLGMETNIFFDKNWLAAF